METFMMVKAKEFRALVDYYKGKINESSLLDRAAHMATEAHLFVDRRWDNPFSFERTRGQRINDDRARSCLLLVLLLILVLVLVLNPLLFLVLVLVLVFFSFALSCCTVSNRVPWASEETIQTEGKKQHHCREIGKLEVITPSRSSLQRVRWTVCDVNSTSVTSEHSSDRAKKAKEETRCFESTFKAEGTPKHSYTSKQMASEKMTQFYWIELLR